MSFYFRIWWPQQFLKFHWSSTTLTTALKSREFPRAGIPQSCLVRGTCLPTHEQSTRTRRGVKSAFPQTTAAAKISLQTKSNTVPSLATRSRGKFNVAWAPSRGTSHREIKATSRKRPPGRCIAATVRKLCQPEWPFNTRGIDKVYRWVESIATGHLRQGGLARRSSIYSGKDTVVILISRLPITKSCNSRVLGKGETVVICN